MAFLTEPARDRILELFDHYVSKQRPEAAARLIDSVNEALRILDHDLVGGRTCPGGYPDLSGLGFLWFKVHRYWFGCRRSADHGGHVLMQILYDQADMPCRLLPDGPVVPWGG